MSSYFFEPLENHDIYSKEKREKQRNCPCESTFSVFLDSLTADLGG